MNRPEPTPILAQRIFAARVTAGLSSRQLAKKVGVSSRAIRFWETGARRPSSANLRPLADALDKPVDWFLEVFPRTNGAES